MKVSVIIEDGVIVVDNEVKRGFDLSFSNKNWRAIQWQDTSGWVEVYQGERTWLNDSAPLQPYISLYNAQVPSISSEPTIPGSITPRQCRLLLLQQNLLSTVEAMIAQQDEATRITWEYALEFRRDDPLLLQLASNLGLSSNQIDEFFIAASQL